MCFFFSLIGEDAVAFRAAFFIFCGIVNMLALIEAEWNVKHAGHGMLLSNHMVAKSLVQLDRYHETRLNIQPYFHPYVETDSDSVAVQGNSILMNNC